MSESEEMCIRDRIQAIDLVFDGGDAGVRGVGTAGRVFLVPEVEVGAVLVEDELLQRVPGLGRRCGGVMAVRRGEVVEVRDAGCVQHAR